jgi:hypothetical protein
MVGHAKRNQYWKGCAYLISILPGISKKGMYVKGQKEDMQCKYRLYKNRCNKDSILEGYCMEHYCKMENQQERELERLSPINGSRCALLDNNPLRKAKVMPIEMDAFFLYDEDL